MLVIHSTQTVDQRQPSDTKNTTTNLTVSMFEIFCRFAPVGKYIDLAREENFLKVS